MDDNFKVTFDKWSDDLLWLVIWISIQLVKSPNPDTTGLGNLDCMVLCTQKLDLHAVQLWGSITWNIRSCQVSVPCLVAPGPGVAGVTWLLYLQAKKQ